MPAKRISQGGYGRCHVTSRPISQITWVLHPRRPKSRVRHRPYNTSLTKGCVAFPTQARNDEGAGLRGTRDKSPGERIEGSLLGYTPAQNDHSISYRKRKGHRWGHQTAYRLLPDAEGEFVRKTGCEAFRFDDRPVRLYREESLEDKTHFLSSHVALREK
jgi:hypothetical protein